MNLLTNMDYHLFEKEVKIKYINRYNMDQTLHYDISSENVKLINQENWDKFSLDIDLYIYFSDEMKNDSYKIIIDEDIKLYCSSVLSIEYAFEKLAEFIVKYEDYVIIYKIEYQEQFKIRNRGIIEGFYGKPYSNEVMIDMISDMQKKKLNTYFYSPKDDDKLRKKAFELYTDEELVCLSNRIDLFKKENLNFVYCLSPGLDINYRNDVNRIKKKIEQVRKLGVKDFALFFDDIHFELSDLNKLEFSSLASAQVFVTNEIYSWLTQKDINSFYFCPTEYWQNYDSPYLKELYDKLDSNIILFFTGYCVIAKTIRKNDFKRSENMALWDNVPVNDIDKLKNGIYIHPYIGRENNLDFLDTFIINPQENYEASRPLIYQMADFARDPSIFDSEKAFLNMLSELFEGYQSEVLNCRDLFKNPILFPTLDYHFNILLKRKEYKKIYNILCSKIYDLETLKNNYSYLDKIYDKYVEFIQALKHALNAEDIGYKNENFFEIEYIIEEILKEESPN